MKNFSVLLSLFCIMLSVSCSKSNSVSDNNDGGLVNPVSPTTPTNVLPTKPETKPQFDNTNFGVYKGVIIGSTGFVVFYINNEENVIKAYLMVDGTKDTLTTKANIVLGQPIVDALFTGKISSLVLNTDKDGNNAKLSDIKIVGHKDVGSYIVHEKSTSLVVCYEGTLEGDMKGTLNLIRFGNLPDTVHAILKYATNDTTYSGYGSNENNTLNKDTTYIDFRRKNQSYSIAGMSGQFYNDSLFRGYFSQYLEPKGYLHGTVSCKRTY